MTQAPPAAAPPTPPAQETTCGLAVFAMILSLTIVLGPLGFLLGLIALSTTGRPGVRGRNMAVAAIVVGLLATVLMVAGFFVVREIRERRHARQQAQHRLPGQGQGQGQPGEEAGVPPQVNDFVRDYNAGNFQAIYDGMAEAYRNRRTLQQTQAGLERMRNGIGNADPLNRREAQAANLQATVENGTEGAARTQDIHWPIRFERRRDPVVAQFRYVWNHDHWEMLSFNFGQNERD